MANLMDYLDWRGDLTLEISPFNEVDALILAELSFVDFDGIVPPPELGRGLPLNDRFAAAGGGGVFRPPRREGRSHGCPRAGHDLENAAQADDEPALSQYDA